MVARSLIRSRIAFACLTALMSLSGVVAPTAAFAAKAKAVRVIRPILPSPEKDAAIVVDGATGKVIYARNPDAIRYPASLTKMMTLYLLFEALDKGTITLDTPMIVSTRAAEQQPTKLSAPLGSSIPVETAIKALTVLSANDIAVVIAEALAGGSESTFASMMTEKAHQLGMTHTNFHNASGLPDLEQLTTARDMALLGRHIAYDFPEYYRYFSVASFTYGGRVYGSHDNLLTAFAGTDGIKTGYTQLSGFNLVTSAGPVDTDRFPHSHVQAGAPGLKAAGTGFGQRAAAQSRRPGYPDERRAEADRGRRRRRRAGRRLRAAARDRGSCQARGRRQALGG